MPCPVRPCAWRALGTEGRGAAGCRRLERVPARLGSPGGRLCGLSVAGAKRGKPALETHVPKGPLHLGPPAVFPPSAEEGGSWCREPR